MKLSVKSLGIAGGSLVLLGLAAIGWNWHLEKLPTNLEPQPKLPVPNAFNTMIEVDKLMVDDGQIMDSIARGPLPDTKMRGLLPEKQALYNKNQNALRLIRIALQQEYRSPSATSTEDPVFYDQNMTVRRAAQLLILEGQIHKMNRNYEKASQSYLDALILSDKTAQGRAFIGDIVARSSQRIARRNLEIVYKHLNSSLIRQLTQRLQSGKSSSYHYVDVIRSEKAFGQMSSLERMKKPGWRLRWPKQDDWDDMEEPSVSFFTKLRLWQFSNRTIFAEYNAYMDSLIEQAEQPFSQRKAAPAPINPAGQLWAIDFTPVQQQSRVNFLSSQTQNDFLLIRLALHAYQLENKELPATLSLLVPKYLPAIPADTFAPSRKLNYRRTGSKYLLYSVGPDNIDNKGKPTQRKDEEGIMRYLARDDSKGDIVAGIND